VIGIKTKIIFTDELPDGEDYDEAIGLEHVTTHQRHHIKKILQSVLNRKLPGSEDGCTGWAGKDHIEMAITRGGEDYELLDDKTLKAVLIHEIGHMYLHRLHSRIMFSNLDRERASNWESEAKDYERKYNYGKVV